VPCKLEQLGLNGRHGRTPGAFDDGHALWEAVCEHELEGVVAKRRSGRYLFGERGWIKTKNRDYWRYEMEHEGALKHRRERQFVEIANCVGVRTACVLCQRGRCPRRAARQRIKRSNSYMTNAVWNTAARASSHVSGSPGF
jgi:hypothetical protein